MNTNLSKKFDFDVIQSIIKAFWVWAGFSPKRVYLLLKRVRIVQKANKKLVEISRSEGLTIPPVLILSATMKCNLSCSGCYSRNYSIDNELTVEEIEDLLIQAEKLGISFFVITGGEPLLKDGLLELLGRHPNILFLLFNNSTQINSDVVSKIKLFSNIIPILSLEGNEEYTDNRRGKGVFQQVMNSMELLNNAGIFFGFSCMISRNNINLAGKDSFIDAMISKGSKIGFYVGYVPSAADADLQQIPKKEEQIYFRKQVKSFQKDKKIILIQLPDDEYEIDGVCMAAGKGFLHINAEGYIEPCPFAHFATDSIRTKSLKDALRSHFFEHIRKDLNLLSKPHLGCALFEHKEELEQLASQLGAKTTETATNKEIGNQGRDNLKGWGM